jgi:hypothetical protein
MSANRNRPVGTAKRALFTAVWSEMLESRVMLSTTAPTPAPLPEDIITKIDQRFYQVAVDVQRNNAKSNLWIQDGIVRLDAQGRIDTYIHTAGDPVEFLPEFRRLGAEIQLWDRGSDIVQAWVPADKMVNLARLGEVADLSQVDYPIANGVTSAGDGILLADKTRSQFAAYGIDGTGVKVGVISDGVKDMLSVGNELPTITVHPYHAGTGNEGTAMLEIVHDLAPGAQLYFSAPSSSLDMVSSIDYLAAQGCNIIVDDLSFFNESYFSDSTVAVAAANAVAQGVTYISAAGNYSDHAHYQAQYLQSQSAFAGGALHKFGNSADDVEFNIAPGANFRAFLEWSDQPGLSGNNYDLYLFDGDSFAQLDASTKIQNGNDQPFEMVDWTNNTGKTVHAQIWINRKTGAASRELELFTLGNTGLNFQTTGDAIFGQQAVPGVIAVAAASAGSPSSVEAFSSRGDSTVYTNFLTQTKDVRQTLDGTAIDGVQTDIGQLGIWPHNPFYGTSAAAPHAAAIAALVKQANFSLPSDKIANIMAATAIDINTPGYDSNSGAGRYDALDAVYAAFTPTAPDLSDASDKGTSNSDNLTSETMPTFIGTVPVGSYVRLFVDGVQSAAVQLAAGATTYNLKVGAALGAGSHFFSVRVASSAAIALANNSNSSIGLAVTIDTAAPIITDTSYAYDAPGQQLNYAFSDILISSLTVDKLLLTNTTTNTIIPSANISLGFDINHKAYFNFPGYANGALPDGKYHATFAAGAVTDQAGNPLVLGNGFDFVVLAGDANHDNTVSFADLVAVAQNYGSSGKLWVNGDFTADGNVSFADLVQVAQNYGKSIPLPGAPVDLQAPPIAAALAAPANPLLKKNDSVFNLTTPIRPALKPAPVRVGKIGSK